MLDSFMSLKTLLISETVQYYVGLLGNLNFNICNTVTSFILLYHYEVVLSARKICVNYNV